MMQLARPAARLAQRAVQRPSTLRAFTASATRTADSSTIKPQLPAGYDKTHRNMDRKLEEVESEDDLLPEGAAVGTVPSDLEQATGLERLEILGKMQGIDIFDMKPLPSDRVGTLKDPIMVKSFGDEQYCGCTGCPADSHQVKWLTISRDRPLERCMECGSCYMMEYVGPPDDPHDDHHHHKHEEPKTFTDYLKPEYYYGKLTPGKWP